MESYLLDWANLLLRWAHVITAIAWVGSSFYFVYLDSNLTPPVDPDQWQGVDGELWAVHGGGFYHPVPTIAVGAISEADHVSSIIAAGRADLCAVARPHLANPSWTLLEAAKIGDMDVQWPVQYRAVKTQLERNLEREKASAAQAGALSPLEQANLVQGV